MKELSIEEKAKRYDEAIERAKELLEIGVKDTRDKRVVLSFFPELKESEDEKMRKSIIYALQNGGFYDNDKTDEAIAWLEKQREQEPVDKVAPKFKVGDWFVKNNIVYHIDKISGVYLTLSTLDGTELVYHTNVLDDDKIHLWTIKDAKDGDVLCTYECDEPKIVFVLKGTPKKHRALRYYCYYNIMYPYFESDSETGCLAPNKEEVKPATKEQCDLLFAKMEEAGYEWNADKKELIKL